MTGTIATGDSFQWVGGTGSALDPNQWIDLRSESYVCVHGRCRPTGPKSEWSAVSWSSVFRLLQAVDREPIYEIRMARYRLPGSQQPRLSAGKRQHNFAGRQFRSDKARFAADFGEASRHFNDLK